MAPENAGFFEKKVPPVCYSNFGISLVSRKKEEGLSAVGGHLRENPNYFEKNFPPEKEKVGCLSLSKFHFTLQNFT